MKKTLIAIMLVTVTSVISAQTTMPNPNPFPKTITVSGSAEMEIIPDEIYVNITLREYQKRGETKKEIEAIKTNFLESCKTTGIADSAISIASFTGYDNYFNFKKRKKDPNLMSSITYQVKFRDSKTMDALVDKLDDDATQSFQIAKTSHSKMPEFRKQLKIKAVQAAKDKGQYLTDAIGEKLGEAITVTEPDESRSVYMANGFVSNAISQSNSYYRDTEKMNADKATEIDFKKIKLRYEVNAVFALK